VNASAITAALLVWLALLGLAALVLGAAALAAWRQRHRGQPELDPFALEPAWKRPRRISVQDFTQLLDGVDELSRQAVAVATAAARAEAVAADARVRSLARQQARELAWHEYDTAQRAYAEVLRARTVGTDVWPLPAGPRAWPVLPATEPLRIGPAILDAVRLGGRRSRPVLVAGGSEPPASAARPLALPAPPEPDPELADPELADPELAGAGQAGAGQAGTGQAGTGQAGTAPAGVDAERQEVARAALAAYRRGDISVEQLRAVYRQFSGWDGGQERREHELVRRRAAEREAHRRYHAAAVAERAAYADADVAVVAAQALAEEAAESAEEARLARVYADECVRRTGGRRTLRTARR
jgi:hypothetical protein